MTVALVGIPLTENHFELILFIFWIFFHLFFSFASFFHGNFPTWETIDFPFHIFFTDWNIRSLVSYRIVFARAVLFWKKLIIINIYVLITFWHFSPRISPFFRVIFFFSIKLFCMNLWKKIQFLCIFPLFISYLMAIAIAPFVCFV